MTESPRQNYGEIVKIRSRQLDEDLAVNSLDALGKLKWNAGVSLGSYKNRGIKLTPAELAEEMEGWLRGDFTERLSDITPMNGGTNVFATFNTRRLITENFASLTRRSGTTNGFTSKSEVLKYFVYRGLYERTPPDILENLQNINYTVDERIVLADRKFNKIIRKLTANDIPRDQGLYYRQTVMPDGVLLGDYGDVVGPIEVKGLKPEWVDYFANQCVTEFRNLQFVPIRVTSPNKLNGSVVNQKFGFDLSREMEFINIIRETGYALPRLGREMPFLLRFPSDAPEDSLCKIGKVLVLSGYENVVIQKLDLSSKELSLKGREFLHSNIDVIEDRNRRKSFSDEEIAAIKVLVSNDQPQLPGNGF